MATSLHDIPGEHVACIPLREHAAATATEFQYVFTAPFDLRITSAHVQFDAAITGVDTNNTSVSLQTETDPYTVSTLAFSSGNDATASDPVDLSPIGDNAHQAAVMAAGTRATFSWTKNANGLKIPTGLLTIKYQGA